MKNVPSSLLSGTLGVSMQYILKKSHLQIDRCVLLHFLKQNIKINQCRYSTPYHIGCIAQAYTSKRCILIQVLPVPNVYIKSGNAYIYFAKSFCCLLMHICIFIAIRPQCVYQVYKGKMHICMSK